MTICNVFGHEPAIAEYVIMTMLVLTHRLFEAEHVANRHSFRHRFGGDEIEPGRHRLQQAKARRGRKPGTPDMTDDDLRLRQQRGEMIRITLMIQFPLPSGLDNQAAPRKALPPGR